MATTKTTSAGQAPDEQGRDLPFSASSTISEVDTRLGLIQWIESARTTLEHLWESASRDDELSRALRRHDVRIGFEWSAEESEALLALLRGVRARMGAVHASLEQEASHV